jgi:hypothetical protein
MLKFYIYLKIKEQNSDKRIDTENICYEIDRKKYEEIKALLGDVL